MTSAQWAVLHHLAAAGPLTVGEMAAHLERAQSVVSEMVDALEARGLLARMRDARDKRRVLVWLTDEAQAWLAEEREVLDRARVAAALSRMTPSDRAALLDGMRALVRAADEAAATNSSTTQPKRRRR